MSAFPMYHRWLAVQSIGAHAMFPEIKNGKKEKLLEMIALTYHDLLFMLNILDLLQNQIQIAQIFKYRKNGKYMTVMHLCNNV